MPSPSHRYNFAELDRITRRLRGDGWDPVHRPSAAVPVPASSVGSPGSVGPPESVGSPGSLGSSQETYRGGWLCPTVEDRARLIDATRKIFHTRMIAMSIMGAGVITMIPWTGIVPVICLFAGACVLVVVDRRAPGSSRPERYVALSTMLIVLDLLIGDALTGGVSSPYLSWVAIPIVGAAARFRLGVFLSATFAATCGLVVAVLLAPRMVAGFDPATVVGVVVVLVALAVAQQPLLDSELRWRRDAVLDPLTGLLNRQGLAMRFREVSEQARLAGDSLALVIFDLDCFKLLNDAHGHSLGDAVLRDVAYLMRRELRSFELLYRIGGEEFLLILPGADLASACSIAEHVRVAVAQLSPGGVAVTLSSGVACAAGDAIAFEAMFDAADRSLYVAKGAGRNRVGYAPGTDGAPVVLEPRAGVAGPAGAAELAAAAGATGAAGSCSPGAAAAPLAA